MANTAQLNLDEMINDIEFSALTEDQKSELMRRMDSFQKDPAQCVPWKQVKTSIQKTLRELNRARS